MKNKCNCNCICGYKSKSSPGLGTHKLFCKIYNEYKINLLSNITYEFLYNEYFVNLKNKPVICNELNINNKDIDFLFNKFNLKNAELYKQRIKDIKRRNSKNELDEYQKILDLFTYDFLYKQYILEEKSKIMLIKEFKIKPKDLTKLFKTLNIKQRTSSEENKTKHTIQKKIDTSLKKYGCKSPSQNNIVKDKQRKTMLDRYGVEFPLQNKDIMEKSKQSCKNKYGVEFPMMSKELVDKQQDNNIKKYGVRTVFKVKSVQDKIKDTNIKKYGASNPFGSSKIKLKIKNTLWTKYGITNPMENPEFVAKIQETKFKNNKTSSYASKNSQQLFWEIYNKLNIQTHIYFHDLNYEFGKYDKDTKKYFYYDFVFTANKKIIEFNGDYYHMNPLLYESTNINQTTQKTAKEVWDFDTYKLNHVRNLGFDILIIWESEYNNNKNEIIEKCISFLNS